MFKVIINTVDHINKRCSVRLLDRVYDDRKKAAANAKLRTKKTYDKDFIIKEVNAFVQPYKNDQQADIFDN